MHLPLRARRRLCPTKHQNVLNCIRPYGHAGGSVRQNIKMSQLNAFALTGTPEALSDKTSKCLNCICPYGHAGGSARPYGHAGGSVKCTKHLP